MKGVDVSHWNTGVNLGRAGIDFAIIKLTEGTDFVDNMANSFIGQCKQHNLLIGLYHFASHNAAAHEADFFFSEIKERGLVGKALPVLDYEVPNANDRAWVEQFVTRYHEISNIWPVLYTSASWCKKFNGSQVIANKCPLWVAGYPMPRTTWPDNTSIPYDIAPWKNAIIWQFTSSLKLPGYSGKVDGDIAYITKTEWQSLAKGAKPADKEKTKKTVSQIADEVIAGKWGNGETRKQRLKLAGYDYTAVQKEVNRKLAPKKKSINELAREVIAGKWGNGAARKNALAGAGYDYKAVQTRVNELLR